MKTKIIAVALFLSALSICCYSQVNISAKKMTFQRKGADVPDFKKTFEVNHPQISGVNSKLKKMLEKTIDYWSNFDMKLEDNLNDDYWLDSFDFNVTYNHNSVLVIELIMEGSGAYPDGSVKTLVIDLTTGKRMYFSDTFTDIGQLLVKIDRAQQDEKNDYLTELKRDNPEDAATALELINEKSFDPKTLDEFSIDDNGVTFIYDYGFPHAVEALEPEGRYFFTWTQMKPHIPNGSLLERFLH